MKPALQLGSVVLEPRMPDGPQRWIKTCHSATSQPRVARFALDNCNDRQRQFIHSLGALLSADVRNFERLLDGTGCITAKEDGTACLHAP